MMQDGTRLDPTLRAWLQQELDAVPEPAEVTERALAAVPRIDQRGRIRFRLRAVLRRLGPARVEGGDGGGIETVLWPADRATLAPGAEATLAPRQGVPVTVAVAVTALVAALGAAILLALWVPGSPLGVSGGAAAPSPSLTSALALEAPREGGRDIIVAADGTGHARSIGEAVDAAVDGDRIGVRPGSYRESLILEKDVVIEGAGEPGDVVIELDDRSPVLNRDGLPTMFSVRHARAQLRGLTLRGARVGTALEAIGGAPVFERLTIDPLGDPATASPSRPREAIMFRDGTRATLRDARVTGYVEVSGGSAPVLQGLVLDGGCLRIKGVGTAPEMSDIHFPSSTCRVPVMSIVEGASPTIRSGTMDLAHDATGIQIHGEGMAPTISSFVIEGGAYGVWIGDGAAGRVARTRVEAADTGFAVVAAHPMLDGLISRGNRIGLSVQLGGMPSLLNNDICENEVDLQDEAGTGFSIADNHIGSPCPGALSRGAAEGPATTNEEA